MTGLYFLFLPSGEVCLLCVGFSLLATNERNFGNRVFFPLHPDYRLFSFSLHKPFLTLLIVSKKHPVIPFHSILFLPYPNQPASQSTMPVSVSISPFLLLPQSDPNEKREAVVSWLRRPIQNILNEIRMTTSPLAWFLPTGLRKGSANVKNRDFCREENMCVIGLRRTFVLFFFFKLFSTLD